MRKYIVTTGDGKQKIIMASYCNLQDNQLVFYNASNAIIDTVKDWEGFKIEYE